jgi:hypothetical protein
MNSQELFNKACIGLAKQGFERSLKRRHSVQCAYRGLDGRRCAIGHAIPDDLYAPKMDVSGSLCQIMTTIGLTCTLGFATDLRRAHDRSLSPASMKTRLAALAREYGITVPKVTS